MPHYKFDQIAYNITDKKMPVPGDEKMYIGLEHLDSGSLKVSRWGSEVELTGQKLVMKKGDILFGRRNTYLRRAAIAPHDGIFSAHGMIFRPKTDVMDPEYFPFFISSNYFMDAAIRISVGSLSPTVNWKTLKELEFDIPSLEEQRKNAALLASINETKEAYQELLLQTDNLVKSQFIETFGDPVDNTKKLPVCQLSEHIRFLTSGSRGWAKYHADDGEWFITIKNVKDCKISLDNVQCIVAPHNAEADRTKLKEGDLLISITADLGRTGVVTKEIADHGAYINQHLTCIRLDRDVLNPLYVAFFMESDAGKKQFFEKNLSSVKAGLNFDSIRTLRLLVPPLEDQERFIAFVEQSDKSKFELKKAIESCNALMKAILFTNLEEKED